MGKSRQRMALFVWRNICRHEEYAGEMTVSLRRLGECEVPAVNWIEGTTKEADIHERLVSSFAGRVGKLDVTVG